MENKLPTNEWLTKVWNTTKANADFFCGSNAYIKIYANRKDDRFYVRENPSKGLVSIRDTVSNNGNTVVYSCVIEEGKLLLTKAIEYVPTLLGTWARQIED